jgi:hypothetical protein
MKRDLELEATIIAKFVAVESVLDDVAGVYGRRRNRARSDTAEMRLSQRRQAWRERLSDWVGAK